MVLTLSIQLLDLFLRILMSLLLVKVLKMSLKIRLDVNLVLKIITLLSKLKSLITNILSVNHHLSKSLFQMELLKIFQFHSVLLCKMIFISHTQKDHKSSDYTDIQYWLISLQQKHLFLNLQKYTSLQMKLIHSGNLFQLLVSMTLVMTNMESNVNLVDLVHLQEHTSTKQQFYVWHQTSMKTQRTFLLRQ